MTRRARFSKPYTTSSTHPTHQLSYRTAGRCSVKHSIARPLTSAWAADSARLQPRGGRARGVWCVKGSSKTCGRSAYSCGQENEKGAKRRAQYKTRARREGPEESPSVRAAGKRRVSDSRRDTVAMEVDEEDEEDDEVCGPQLLVDGKTDPEARHLASGASHTQRSEEHGDDILCYIYGGSWRDARGAAELGGGAEIALITRGAQSQLEHF